MSGAKWRGEVRHGGTDRRAYFRDWDHLVAILRESLAESERGRTEPGGASRG